MGLAGDSPWRGVVSSRWVCAGQCHIHWAYIQSCVVRVGVGHQGPDVTQCWVPACRAGHTQPWG